MKRSLAETVVIIAIVTVAVAMLAAEATMIYILLHENEETSLKVMESLASTGQGFFIAVAGGFLAVKSGIGKDG